MAMVCFAQLMPVSCEFLNKLSPMAYRYYQELAVISNSDCVGSISVDRNATALSGLWWASLAFWAWMLIVVTHANDRRLAKLERWLLIVAIAQATYGLLMQLSGVELGAYFEPKEYYLDHATGTLINRNHFAALMYIASALAIPSLLVMPRHDRRQGGVNKLVNWVTSEKLLIRLGLIIFAIAVVNSHSRMGATALGVGLTLACCFALVMAVIPSLKGDLASAKYLFLLAASIAIVDLIVVSYWFDLEQVVERIQTTTAASEGRDEYWRDILGSNWPRDVLYFGSGAGSFEPVYSQYESVVRLARVDHAHNDWLQFWLEYGMAGYTLLVVGFVLSVVTLMKQSASRAIAGLALLVMLMLHATVDFSLRIPAVAIYLLAVLICLMSQPAKSIGTRVKKS
jgi:hypothetical protein